jgi:hypothetical protein
MGQEVERSDRGESPRRRGQTDRPVRSLMAALVIALLLAAGAGCGLVHATYVPPERLRGYRCNVVLVDTASGEQVALTSDDPWFTTQGIKREFFDWDWDGNGVRHDDDALYDWRRYVAYKVLATSRFEGGSWCARPTWTFCNNVTGVRNVRRRDVPGPVPDVTLTECPVPPRPRLEISAPGLTPGGAFQFPDAPLGSTSAPVTFTISNMSGEPLRVLGADFIGGPDSPDFRKTADTCEPTTAERAAGRGHLLPTGGSCTVEVVFQPQSRAGAFACATGMTTDACRRQQTLFVTGEVDGDRGLTAPLTVALSGRALGNGVLVVENGEEVCFRRSVTGMPGSCTETITIRMRNGGTGPLTINSAGLVGDSMANGFRQLAPFPALPRTLGPGEVVEAHVRYCNPGSGSADGQFAINSSDPRNPTTVVRLVNPLVRRC